MKNETKENPYIAPEDRTAQIPVHTFVMQDFREWLVDCIMFCAENFIGPDDFEWSFDGVPKFKEMFANGYNHEDACMMFFNSN